MVLMVIGMSGIVGTGIGYGLTGLARYMAKKDAARLGLDDVYNLSTKWFGRVITGLFVGLVIGYALSVLDNNRREDRKYVISF